MEAGHDLDLEAIAVFLRPEDDDLPVKYTCRKCATDNNATPAFTGAAEWATWRCTCGEPVLICRHCPGILIPDSCKKVHAHVRGRKQLAKKSASHRRNTGHRFFKTARYTCSTEDPDLRMRLLVALGKRRKELRSSIAYLRKTNADAHSTLEARIDAEWRKCHNLVALVGSVLDISLPSSSSNAAEGAEGAAAAADAGSAGGVGPG